jgi:hypothetical protein
MEIIARQSCSNAAPGFFHSAAPGFFTQFLFGFYFSHSPQTSPNKNGVKM